MVESLEKIKERIARLQEERPAYREILDFYALILEEQMKIRPQLRITSAHLDEELVKTRQNKDAPLLGREGFQVDLDAAQKLFYTVGEIGQRTTPKMGDEIPKIEEAVESGRLDLRDLLSRHYDEGHLNREAGRLALDKGILSFLVKVSVRPYLEAQMEELREAVDLETWLKRNCPLCGSLPQMAELRDEGGKRYLECSFCGCQWRWERIACPYCPNREHESLQYLFSEEEEAYRVDLCDQCEGYIKTVDSRKLDYEPSLHLEDIATIHLDILAVEKGYRRPVNTPWGPITGV